MYDTPDIIGVDNAWWLVTYERTVLRFLVSIDTKVVRVFIIPSGSVIRRVYRLEQVRYPNRRITRWTTPSPSVTFQFSNQVSEMAKSTREEVVRAYNLPLEGQAEGTESTWKVEL